MPRITKENVGECFTYQVPGPERAKKHDTVNNGTAALAKVYMETCPESPELTLAIRCLQEARMWVNAALATNEPTKSQ